MDSVQLECPKCHEKGVVMFHKKEDVLTDEKCKELDFYALNEPYTYVKILKDSGSLEECYMVVEPELSLDEKNKLDFVKEELQLR